MEQAKFASLMSIERLNPHSCEARRLLTLSDEYAAALYPVESNHMESPDVLAQSSVLFLGGYVDRELVACGAVKIVSDNDTYGEIKRVYVIDQFRGKGFSKQIMLRLEEHLRSRCVWLARLETGIKQQEALGLYRKLGYAERTPFGNYKPDPLSVFMEKPITM